MLSERGLRLLRWRAQRLAPRDGSGDPAAIVRAIGAVQSQDPAAAALALRARGTGFVADDVERARVEERTVVRTWVQRGTLHLVAVEDLAWMLDVFRPTVLAQRQRRWDNLGFDDDFYEAALGVLRSALADGPLTRSELGERWSGAGLDVSGPRLTHLITRAAIDGEICDGADRGRERTWVRLADWVDVPVGPRGESALAELARRYLAGHGPTEPRDLAAWSGLRVSDARKAWELIGGELVELPTAIGPRWVLAAHADTVDDPVPDDSVVRLLGGFDAALLGYDDRAFVVPPPHTARVSGGGLRVLPAIAIDGVVVGTWRAQRRRASVTVELEPFDPLDPDLLVDEVGDIGRFLGLAAEVA